MNNRGTLAGGLWTAIATLAMGVPVTARADSAQDEWQWSGTIYVWLPSLNGQSSFPVSSGGSSISVDGSDILDSLNFAFMGMLQARKGQWGLLTDLIYLDLSASQSNTRDLTIGDVVLPASVTADLHLGITGWLWTLGGTYRLVDEPEYALDLLAGARMLDLSEDLSWNFTGDISSLPLQGPSGSSDASETNWDAVVGIKGRAAFGNEHKWFAPYYLDVGTGDSDLTWQAMAGIGYAYRWGDVVGVWRYLDYNFASGSPYESVTFSGPAIGVTFHF
jgi:hypothetical protein